MASRIFRQMIVLSILGAIAGVCAAAWLTGGRAETYSARALLLLSPLPFALEDQVSESLRDGRDSLDRVSYVAMAQPEPLAMPDYEMLLTSEAMAERVADRLKEHYAQSGADGSWIEPRSVRGAFQVRHKIVLTGVQRVQYQQVVELQAVSPEAQRSADIADAWADAAVTWLNELRLEGPRKMAAMLGERLAAAEQRLSSAEATPAQADESIAREARDQRAFQLRLLRDEVAQLTLSLRQAEILASGAPEWQVVSRPWTPTASAGLQRAPLLAAAAIVGGVAAAVAVLSLHALRRTLRMLDEQAA